MLLSLEALISRKLSTEPAFIEKDKVLRFCDLYSAVAHQVQALADAPDVIGLLAQNSLDWVIADLAITAAGKTFVPLPSFFSLDQIKHIAEDANIGLFLCDEVHLNSVTATGRPSRLMTIANSNEEASFDVVPGGVRIIYTSGTTGQPKGVQLGEAQLNFTIEALAKAISATENDRYLSVLPFALLLEELCGLHVPLMVGGTCIIDSEAAEAVASGRVSALQESAIAMQPSVMVLVPELLRAWCASLMLSQERAPQSLRVVAVGGAKTPPEVIALASDLGLPAYEGYGLSECGSVVALNTPGAIRAGTVGRPLPGLDVKIIDGEITVSGPNVMSGYLGKELHKGRWATGDLGDIDEDGFLIVHGRKDSVLVNGFGRNVSPEWVEAMMTNDFRIARAVLAHGQDGLFCALIVPTALGQAFFNKDDYADNLASLRELCASVPDYAKPDDFICVGLEESAAADLFTASGRPRRRDINNFIKLKFTEAINV